MSIRNAEVRIRPSHKVNDPIEMRSVPFGPPTSRDNTEWNPGRQQYGPNNGWSYATFDGRNIYFLNRFRMVNKDDVWQSGPTANDLTNDYYVEGPGYWTSPSGTNCDWAAYGGAGSNPHKAAGMTITTKGKQDGNKIYLYDVGHVTSAQSQNETNEYGCVGFSAIMRPDHDDYYNDDDGEGKTSLASIGLRHAYCMYRADASDEEVDQLTDLLDNLLETIEDTSDFILNEIPDEVLDTYDPVTSKFSDDFDDVDLLRPFLSSGMYEKFESMEFKDSETLPKIIQLFAEIILNTAGKDVTDYTYILDEFTSKAKDNGKLSGIDMFDLMVRLSVSDDKFVQENAELFSLKNVVDPLFNIDTSTITDQDTKYFVLNCFLDGGVATKDEETGEWTCSFEDQNLPLEFSGPTGPYTVSTLTSSEVFKQWCTTNKGNLSPGTEKECAFVGIEPAFTETDYNQDIANFMDWCEQGGGVSKHYPETREYEEYSTCVVSYDGSTQTPFREWCVASGGNLKSTTNGYECALPGAKQNLTQSDYDKDAGGFVNWCNKNEGKSEYVGQEDKATCKLVYYVQSVEDFEKWCIANNGGVIEKNGEDQCIFQKGNSISISQYNNYPNGFIDWCSSNGGTTATSVDGEGIGCVVSEETPITNFDDWCLNNRGTVLGGTPKGKVCIFDGLRQPEYTESDYKTNDIDVFRRWCISDNQGTVSVRVPRPNRTDMYCDIITEYSDEYDVETFCRANNGRFIKSTVDEDDRCEIPYFT